MVTLAGLTFSIEPESSLTPAERDAIRLLADPASADQLAPAHLPPFRIELEREAFDSSTTPPEAARVSWARSLCLLDHAGFRAEIDPLRQQARVFRGDDSSVGLVVTLRTSLACRLPFEGGVVLHAAGLEHEGKGVAFFGPSGAGKSTLTRCSSWPVMSDELVAVLPDSRGGFALRGTPFRKTPPGAAHVACETAALRALVELDKGPTLAVRRIGHAEALRKLIGSAAVPAAPPVWSAALAVLGRLVREVPCYRMAWSPGDPPFARLASALSL